MKHSIRLKRGTHVVFKFVLVFTVVRADYASAELQFGPPVNFGPVVNSDSADNHPVLSPDGLTLYFHSSRPGGTGGADIWFSTRTQLEAEWSAPENYAAINTPANEVAPDISNDGLSFVYNDGNVPGEFAKIFQLSRTETDAAWSPQSALPAPINDGVSNNSNPFITAGGNTIVFSSDRAGGSGAFDIYEASRNSTSDPWIVRSLGPDVNSSHNESNPSLSPDGLTLLFSSDRPDGVGSQDIWFAQRDATGDDWGVPTNVGPGINTAANDTPSQYWTREGLSLLMFKSAGLQGEGRADIFYAPIVPEPSTAAMSLCGMLLVAGLLRRRG